MIGFHSPMHLNVAIPSVLIGLLGISIAAMLYKSEGKIAIRITESLGLLYTATLNKFYIDEIYLFITKKIIFGGVSRPIAWFDRQVIDGTMNLFGIIVLVVSRKIKGMQSGQLQQYGFAFVAGAIGLVMAFVYLWT